MAVAGQRPSCSQRASLAVLEQLLPPPLRSHPLNPASPHTTTAASPFCIPYESTPTRPRFISRAPAPTPPTLRCFRGTWVVLACRSAGCKTRAVQGARPYHIGALSGRKRGPVWTSVCFPGGNAKRLTCSCGSFSATGTRLWLDPRIPPMVNAVLCTRWCGASECCCACCSAHVSRSQGFGSITTGVFCFRFFRL